MMKESTRKFLMKDLLQIDLDILQLWIKNKAELPPTQWSLFIKLLETRIQVLKCIKSQGALLTEERCVPSWLSRLSNEDEPLSLRDLKIQFEKIQKEVKLLESELREENWDEPKSI